MNESVKKYGLQFGLYIFLINASYILIGYTVDLSLLVSAWGGMILFALNVTLLVVASIQVRKEMGGFINFKDVFSTFMTGFVVYSVPVILINYLLFVVVDPEAAEQLKDITIQTTAERFNSLGLPEADIDRTMEEIQSLDQFSLLNQFKGLGISFIGYSILGLIVSAIVKKKDPSVL